MESIEKFANNKKTFNVYRWIQFVGCVVTHLFYHMNRLVRHDAPYNYTSGLIHDRNITVSLRTKMRSEGKYFAG